MIDTITTVWSMAIGGMGGIIWWALPPQPQDSRAIVLRIAVGVVVGFVANSVSAVSPFDASGNWSPTGIGELLTLGFGGLASLSGVLPDKYAQHIDQSVASALTGNKGTQTGASASAKTAEAKYDVDVISEGDEAALVEKLRDGHEYVATLKLGNRDKIILRKPETS